jgi:Zn-dependent metalloprotease
MLPQLVFAVALACVASGAGTAHAQEPGASSRQALEAARNSNPRLKFEIDPATGLPSRITGLGAATAPGPRLGATRAPTASEARAAAEAWFRSEIAAAAFETKGGPKAIYVATQARRDPDVAGQTIVQIEQRVGGVPVFGSTVRVTVSPSLTVTDVTGALSAVTIASATPKITGEEAIETARTWLKSEANGRRVAKRITDQADTLPASAEVTVFDPALLRKKGLTASAARLTYMVRIDTFRIFVDADNRDVVYTFIDQPYNQPFLMKRRVFDLARSFEFPGRTVVDETTDMRVEPLPPDAAEVLNNNARVLGFFKSTYDRNGIKEADGPAIVENFIRHGDTQGAYWCLARSLNCPKPSVMVYGPQYAGAIDVVGHETTHGIIVEEANLVYADEPGAVNEALADIFGTLIEFQARPGNGNWVIGEELPGYRLTNPIRRLANPNLSDADGKSLFDPKKVYDSRTNRGQPDHYDDFVKREDPLCETTNDYFNGCVHFNSGILNKFAHLVSEGGRHRGIVVKGIGREKLARLAYRALTTQLAATSGLKQAANSFVDACTYYAEASFAGFTAADCDHVRAARDATGLATQTS